MVAAPKTNTLRRMKLDELVSKLEQIEQQAALTVAEYPGGLTLERQRLIIAIAKQLQSHLKDQLREGPRQALDERRSERHLHSIDGKARS